MTAELREMHSSHREKYKLTRQPLLDGLASELDLELFREAQARACELLVLFVSFCFCFCLFAVCLDVMS